MTDLDIEEMVRGYLTCALFTTEQDGDNFDSIYTVDDFEEGSVVLAKEILWKFCDLNLSDVFALLEMGADNFSIGCDLWYMQNGYGVGFWDRGTGEIGERLAEFCRHLPERSVVSPDEDEYSYGPTVVIE